MILILISKDKETTAVTNNSEMKITPPKFFTLKIKFTKVLFSNKINIAIQNRNSTIKLFLNTLNLILVFDILNSTL